MKKKFHISKIFEGLLLGIYSMFLFVPLTIVVLTAFKSNADVYANPLGLPKVWIFSNFKEAFVKGSILQCSLNSIIVTACSVFLIIVINTLCAYGIHKIFYKKIGAFIYSLILMGMMVPAVGYVSLILLYRHFHLYNNLQGLIVNAVATSVPFSMFILVGFFRSIPKEFEEAAVIDGCSDLQALWYVLVPVIKPAVATIAIFNLLSTWNNLFTPLLLINKPKLFTIPIGLRSFRGNYSTDYGLMFAGALIVSVPMLILYFKFQKSFVESLAGGIKS